MPDMLAPSDERVLFRRVVDDILTKIERGELYPGAALPSARKMADLYGVGVMTIQRALRELQNMKVTYSIAGKGTFVHPDITDQRDDAALTRALADPARVHRLGRYLAEQFAILDHYKTAEGTKAKNAAARELADNAQAHAGLLAELTRAATTTADRAPAGPDFHGDIHWPDNQRP
jgi:DNA-binding transcriptional regulator YhcF (GntR family)